MLDKKTKKYLDSLPDDQFLCLMNIQYGRQLPQWEECSKEEYEECCGKDTDSITELLEKYLLNPDTYRRIPYWNNGGGIMDQISGREPDGYTYKKLVGYKFVLMMGEDMCQYCATRKCMDRYFN